MKKIICYMLILGCCRGIAAGAEDTGNVIIFSPEFCSSAEPGSGGVGHTACLDSVIYGVVGQNLYRWDPADSGDPQFFCTLPVNEYWDDSFMTLKKEELAGDVLELLTSRVDGLAAGDGKLWGYNLTGGRIGEIDEAGIHWLPVALDMSGFFRDGGLICRFHACSAFVDHGYLYLFGEEGDSFPLVRFSLDSGKSERISIRNAECCCPYGEQQALLIRREGRKPLKLSVLDLNTGSLEDLPQKLPVPGRSGGEPDMAGGLAYDADSGRICFFLGETVWASDGGNDFVPAGNFNPLTNGMPLTSDPAFPAWILPDGWYAICMYCSLYVCRPETGR